MKVVDLDESTVEYQNPYVGNDYPGVVPLFHILGTIYFLVTIVGKKWAHHLFVCQTSWYGTLLFTFVCA